MLLSRAIDDGWSIGLTYSKMTKPLPLSQEVKNFISSRFQCIRIEETSTEFYIRNLYLTNNIYAIPALLLFYKVDVGKLSHSNNHNPIQSTISVTISDVESYRLWNFPSWGRRRWSAMEHFFDADKIEKKQGRQESVLRPRSRQVLCALGRSWREEAEDILWGRVAGHLLRPIRLLQFEWLRADCGQIKG